MKNNFESDKHIDPVFAQRINELGRRGIVAAHHGYVVDTKRGTFLYYFRSRRPIRDVPVTVTGSFFVPQGRDLGAILEGFFTGYVHDHRTFTHTIGSGEKLPIRKNVPE